MINDVLTKYREKYKFEKFYDNLQYNIKTWPNDHLRNNRFLDGYNSGNPTTAWAKHPKTEENDIRVDLPVWFGNPMLEQKVVVLGLEPRDTDKSGRLNIEKKDKYVFGTPFALERGKGPYYSAFHEFIMKEDSFVYFTDVVKTYTVAGNKQSSDQKARKDFFEQAEAEKGFLLAELEIIAPKMVIALGNDSHKFLTSILADKYKVVKVRHPSNGGAKVARQSLSEIVIG